MEKKMEKKMEMEVARMDGGSVVVRDPFDANKGVCVQSMDEAVAYVTREVRLRRAERREQFNALGNLDAAPLDAVKKLRWAIEADGKSLLAAENGVRESALKLTGLEAIITQLRGNGSKIDPMSDRGAFAEMVAALKAREDAAKPAAPKHTYIYAVLATDAEHMALQRAIRKVDEHFDLCIPQTDEETNLAKRLFKSR